MQDRVWAEIDLGAVRRNLQRLQAMVGPTVRVLAVLKADAYGLGAVPLARAVSEAGAAWIGLANVDEALELVEAGVKAPLLILGEVVPEEVPRAVKAGVACCVHSAAGAALLARQAARAGRPAEVHLKVDTGMGRLGAPPESALALLAAVRAEPALRLGGIATHLATPRDPEYTRTQLARYAALLEQARKAGIQPGLRHAAATGALARYPEARFDMVRPGIGLYGVDPGGAGLREAGLEPALALRSRVVHLKEVPAGASIGYGGTHVTSGPTRLAVVPVGYSDGLPLVLSNRGRALIEGREAPVVGQVSMDYCTLDVGELAGVAVGQEVTFVGRSGGAEVTLEELALRAGTIPYALSCGLGRRVRRVYRDT